MSIEDKAQELELQMWRQLNERTPSPSSKTFTQDEPGYGPAVCGECGEPMPDNRRRLGSHLCGECKEDLERRKRR